MSIGIVSAAYIAAAVLFILSLGGLSGQESAKRAVWYGIAGMALSCPDSPPRLRINKTAAAI